MEELSSVWNYQENNNTDQFKELLIYTTELESSLTEAREEKKRNEEIINQLVQLLKETSRERDEAKDQLQTLLNKFLPSSPTDVFPPPLLSTFQPKSLPPPINSIRGNSSITESADSFSETNYNHQQYSNSTSPPIESFYAVSSPEFSNINMGESNNVRVSYEQQFVHTRNDYSSVCTDQGSMRIENLIKGKILPEKGKLLESVKEAGPLLQTLLLAGPLPQWRNPPPLRPLQLPSLSISGASPVQNSLLFPYSDHNSLMYSTPMLNFSSGTSMGFVDNSVRSMKRQRIL